MIETKLEKHISYYPFIDGLRALAVLAVIFYHLNPSYIPGGFVGVDVFFVISGFIVSASVEAFKGNGVLSFFAIFYARRIKRIFPALIFMLLTVFIISATFIPSSWLSGVNQQTGLYAFFGFSNIILSSTGRDYFAPTTEFNPFTHTWSLGVEEQFYLVFPILYFFWFSAKRKYVSGIIYSLLGLASLIISYQLSTTQPTQAYFLTIGRFWELASGVLLYQLMATYSGSFVKISWFKNLRSIVGGISFLGLIISFIVTGKDNFPMPGAVLAVCSTLGIFFCLYQNTNYSILNYILSTKYLRFVGKLSYSLYLWHWPVFVFFRWSYGLNIWKCQLSALVITFILSLLSWIFIESPFRRNATLSSLNNWVVLILGVFVISLSSFLAAKINESSGRISQSVVMKSAEDWYPEGYSTAGEYQRCPVETQNLNVGGGLLIVYKPKDCASLHEMKHKLFVIGDSHALAYAGLFREFATRYQTTIFSYNNGGCPFLSFTPGRDMDLPVCSQYSQASLQDISQRAEPGDVIFFASLRLPRFVDQWAYFGDVEQKKEFFSAVADSGRLRTVEYAKLVLKPLVDKGVDIVFEAPKPLFKIPAFRCADWYDKENPICEQGTTIERKVIEDYRRPVLSSYAELKFSIPLQVWDPLPVLCPGEVCNIYHNDKPLYFDGDHISGYGNRYLFPSFAKFMLPLLEGHKELSRDALKDSFNIDFSKVILPINVEFIKGLSGQEEWGRWTDARLAPEITIDYIKSFPERFSLSLSAIAFGPNKNEDVKITIGGETRVVRFSNESSMQTVKFSGIKNASSIKIQPPHPESPKNLHQSSDARLLGIGVLSLVIQPDS